MLYILYYVSGVFLTLFILNFFGKLMGITLYGKTNGYDYLDIEKNQHVYFVWSLVWFIFLPLHLLCLILTILPTRSKKVKN